MRRPALRAQTDRATGCTLCTVKRKAEADPAVVPEEAGGSITTRCQAARGRSAQPRAAGSGARGIAAVFRRPVHEARAVWQRAQAMRQRADGMVASLPAVAAPGMHSQCNGCRLTGQVQSQSVAKSSIACFN